jgi:type II secretory pathway component PulJ
MDNYIYLGVTIAAVLFSVGSFVGINNMSFKTISEKLEHMGDQIKEVRDDQKTIAELNTRMAIVEKGIQNLEKCQDHLQTDMTLLKKRQIRKTED